MDDKVRKWRNDGNYLPKFMKDFHDQKDLFKSIHQLVDVEGHDYAKHVSWVAGPCYVVDIFLWFMARHGYTLQKTRTRLDFDDLSETLDAAGKERLKRFAGLLTPLDNHETS